MDPNNNRSRPQRVISLWEVIIIIIIKFSKNTVLHTQNEISMMNRSHSCEKYMKHTFGAKSLFLLCKNGVKLQPLDLKCELVLNYKSNKTCAVTADKELLTICHVL